MLTYAIGFIQNIQLIAFAIVFVLMAVLDRKNLAFRWLATAYVAGLVGGVFQFADHLLPGCIWIPCTMLAAPLGYACIHAGIVEFLQRGRMTRWLSFGTLLGVSPLYIVWSLPSHNAHFEMMARISTLADLNLAIQTVLSASLLFSTREEVTAWPRRVMGTFLAFYASVECARVATFAITGGLPDHTAPWVEIASGIVYIVSCSMLPINFIWMMNTRLHDFMSRQMTTDLLTQVLNRRGLQAAGEVEIARYLRDKAEFAVALMDIDHFKRLNDTFGHAAGDCVLAEAARLVRAMIRKSDTVGRLGGEEFVLLLPSTGSTGAAKIIESLRAGIEKHAFHSDQRNLNITASFGITFSAGRSHLTWENLLREADEALYSAKREGRNCKRFYDPGVAAVTTEAQFV